MLSKQLTKNFNSREFDSPDIPGSGLKINIELVEQLQVMRDIYKKPIIIKSGVRTISYNKKVKGKFNSAHLVGNAVDISCTTSSQRYSLIGLALIVGFTRIGIGSSFIHLDISKSKPKEVIWLYD